MSTEKFITQQTRTTLTATAAAILAAMVVGLYGYYYRHSGVIDRWQSGGTTVTLSRGWTPSRNLTLRVSGNGAMSDYPEGSSINGCGCSDDVRPWYRLAIGMGKPMKSLVVEKGVTYIGNNVFNLSGGEKNSGSPKPIGKRAFVGADTPDYARRTTVFIFAGVGLAVAALFFLLYKKTRLFHRLYNFYIKKP